MYIHYLMCTYYQSLAYIIFSQAGHNNNLSPKFETVTEPIKHHLSESASSLTKMYTSGACRLTILKPGIRQCSLVTKDVSRIESECTQEKSDHRYLSCRCVGKLGMEADSGCVGVSCRPVQVSVRLFDLEAEGGTDLFLCVDVCMQHPFQPYVPGFLKMV